MDALSDTKIRNARPADKEYTIADGQGLIRYFFERAVVGAEGETRWPDFSIEEARPGTGSIVGCSIRKTTLIAGTRN